MVSSSGMSIFLKALSTPQFNWYNKWTSLGPDGLQDQAIKEGLKQPLSVTMNGKEFTVSITPNQACFCPEFFLAQTIPNFQSKNLLCLPANKQRKGPVLSWLMEQCFQEVGLTN